MDKMANLESGKKLDVVKRKPSRKDKLEESTLASLSKERPKKKTSVTQKIAFIKGETERQLKRKRKLDVVALAERTADKLGDIVEEHNNSKRGRRPKRRAGAARRETVRVAGRDIDLADIRETRRLSFKDPEVKAQLDRLPPGSRIEKFKDPRTGYMVAAVIPPGWKGQVDMLLPGSGGSLEGYLKDKKKDIVGQVMKKWETSVPSAFLLVADNKGGNRFRKFARPGAFEAMVRQFEAQVDQRMASLHLETYSMSGAINLKTILRSGYVRDLLKEGGYTSLDSSFWSRNVPLYKQMVRAGINVNLLHSNDSKGKRTKFAGRHLIKEFNLKSNGRGLYTNPAWPNVSVEYTRVDHASMVSARLGTQMMKHTGTMELTRPGLRRVAKSNPFKRSRGGERAPRSYANRRSSGSRRPSRSRDVDDSSPDFDPRPSYDAGPNDGLPVTSLSDKLTVREKAIDYVLARYLSGEARYCSTRSSIGRRYSKKGKCEHYVGVLARQVWQKMTGVKKRFGAYTSPIDRRATAALRAKRSRDLTMEDMQTHLRPGMVFFLNNPRKYRGKDKIVAGTTNRIRKIADVRHWVMWTGSGFADNWGHSHSLAKFKRMYGGKGRVVVNVHDPFQALRNRMVVQGGQLALAAPGGRVDRAFA